MAVNGDQPRAPYLGGNSQSSLPQMAYMIQPGLRCVWLSKHGMKKFVEQQEARAAGNRAKYGTITV
jgi:hypothetical protein